MIDDKDAKKKSIKIQKGSALIHIDSSPITTNQRRIMNALMYVVKQKINSGTQLHNPFTTTISDIKRLTGIKTTNLKEIKESLKGLDEIKTEYNIVSKDKNTWGVMRFINNPQIDYDPKIGAATVVFDVPHQILTLIKKPEESCFAIIDLLVVRGLKNKYSIALYELARDYYKIQKKKFEINEFKKIIGATGKYQRFNMFAKRVLDPAKEDVNRNTSMEVNYEVEQYGREIKYITLCMKYSEDRVNVHQIESKKTEEQERQIKFKELADQYEPDCETIDELVNLGVPINQARKWMKDYGEDYILKNIETINNKIAGGYEVHNKASFLNKSLQDNYSYKSPEQKEKDEKNDFKTDLNNKIEMFENYMVHNLSEKDMVKLQIEIVEMFESIGNFCAASTWIDKDVEFIMR